LEDLDFVDDMVLLEGVRFAESEDRPRATEVRGAARTSCQGEVGEVSRLTRPKPRR